MQNAHCCEMQTQPTYTVYKITIFSLKGKAEKEAFDNGLRPTVGPMCYECWLSAIPKGTVAVTSPCWSWHQTFTATKRLLNAHGI